ncbi:MAG: tRNA (adenosine(37)-N6)-threonylcarbamoyltransferase complex dimerization subunit type 1 TsaB [Bryobacterales bacterium]|nr:tRNA (adenosine(37)-N6)-threonylcarbamoyltransferase complex dimerization subunit type 1 TsaB [Bryobacterales bacterium]
MRLLAVDTARRHGSVALLRDGEVVASASLGVAPGFGEVLFPTIQELLRGQALAVADIEAFAGATGPGSFTGIRVGLVAVKALAEVGERPVAGVSSLRALAASASCEGPRAALLDARRGELFCGCYGPGAEALASETVGVWDAVWPGVRDLCGYVVANEPSLFAEGGAAEQAPAGRRLSGPRELAGAVAMVAAADLAAGGASAPEDIQANYIRKPSARLPAVMR